MTAEQSVVRLKANKEVVNVENYMYLISVQSRIKIYYRNGIKITENQNTQDAVIYIHTSVVKLPWHGTSANSVALGLIRKKLSKCVSYASCESISCGYN